MTSGSPDTPERPGDDPQRLRAALEAATWELRVADAMTGALNLRRTLARAADLAVPELGTWASVCLWDGARLRRATRGPGDARTEPPDEQLAPGDPAVGRLLALAQLPCPPPRPATAEDLSVLGAPDPVVDELAGRSPLAIRPLRWQGRTLGAIAVAAHHDRPTDAGRLEGLARRAAPALSAAAVHEERTALTATLRASLLPAPIPRVPGMDIGAAYRSAQEAMQIGGDFYDVRPDPAGWSLTLGDVCGKGVDAAVLTGQVRQSLRTASLVASSPSERLALLNDAMRATDGRSFVTLLHGVLERRDGGLGVRLATGGHPPPLLLRADRTVHPVPVRGTLIGMLASVEAAEVEVQMAPGETLLCFTDGLPEALGPSGRLGLAPVRSVLTDCGGLTAQAVADRVMQLALEHLAGNPHDDIAVLTVQVTAP